jgi:hypothetical protein
MDCGKKKEIQRQSMSGAAAEAATAASEAEDTAHALLPPAVNPNRLAEPDPSSRERLPNSPNPPTPPRHHRTEAGSIDDSEGPGLETAEDDSDDERPYISLDRLREEARESREMHASREAERARRGQQHQWYRGGTRGGDLTPQRGKKSRSADDPGPRTPTSPAAPASTANSPMRYSPAGAQGHSPMMQIALEAMAGWDAPEQGRRKERDDEARRRGQLPPKISGGNAELIARSKSPLRAGAERANNPSNPAYKFGAGFAT